jgi:hypothetical protein
MSCREKIFVEISSLIKIIIIIFANQYNIINFAPMELTELIQHSIKIKNKESWQLNMF